MKSKATLSLNGMLIAQGVMEEAPSSSFETVEIAAHEMHDYCDTIEISGTFLQMSEDPDLSDLEDPLFNAIWETIKEWDISKSSLGYSYATGNDVMLILKAIRPVVKQMMTEDLSLLLTSSIAFHRECAQAITEKNETVSRSAPTYSSDWSSET